MLTTTMPSSAKPRNASTAAIRRPEVWVELPARPRGSPVNIQPSFDQALRQVSPGKRCSVWREEAVGQETLSFIEVGNR
ncbi:hypothetical protein GCM10009525_43020 [Streptosporangium amethystogenes subsp. fukuiense]